jgi:hypothetical protein
VTAAVDWASLHVAGAFVLGAVLGTVATIRIMRAVALVIRTERRKDDADT